ncbi:MAG: HD domain-containing protein [Candidatus Parcubacteria bacterium]|nr:HD domain-containing protein [Candidatus Parcubacteria bacterium]
MSAKLYELSSQRDFKTFNYQTQFLIWAVTQRKDKLHKDQPLHKKEIYHLKCLAKNLRRSPSIIEAGEKLLKNEALGWNWQDWLQIVLSDCLHPFHGDSYHHSIRIAKIISVLKEDHYEKFGFVCFPDLGIREFAQIKTKLYFSQDDWECLENAAFYHDLGKLGFPSGFWETPGEFTPLQKECRKIHPALFFPLGEMFAVPLRVTGLALAHHYLNLGYPTNGWLMLFHGLLQDEKFQQLLGLLTTLDVYDGMRGPRCYRRAILSHDDVMGKILSELGRIGPKFMPLLVVADQQAIIGSLYPQ